MHTPRINNVEASLRNNSEQSVQDMPELLGIRPESNNADSVSFACDSCHGPLTQRQQQQGNRFCSHACYCVSIRLPIEPRFWSHVDKNGPIHPVLGTRCWLWTANCAGRPSKTYPNRRQHGQFTYSVDGRQYHVYAHRFAWELKHGPIPHGKQICHHCDVPPCVNDAHHFLGTQDDNMKDAARKHRLTVPRTRTLSLLDRLTIQRTADYRGVCVELARRYGVTKTCISLIRSGRFVGMSVERVVRLVESA